MLSVSIGLMGLRLFADLLRTPRSCGHGCNEPSTCPAGTVAFTGATDTGACRRWWPDPIFETLACAYGGYDGLIGWAFEDHGGPVSTAWAALCAGLDAPDFIQMQAALDE